jgi:hypothetical protein
MHQSQFIEQRGKDRVALAMAGIAGGQRAMPLKDAGEMLL